MIVESTTVPNTIRHEQLVKIRCFTIVMVVIYGSQQEAVRDTIKKTQSYECKPSNTFTINFSINFSLFYLALIVFALYLVWKCNGGFDFPSVLVAIFFPWIYIIYYALAKNGTCALRQAQNAYN